MGSPPARLFFWLISRECFRNLVSVPHARLYRKGGQKWRDPHARTAALSRGVQRVCWKAVPTRQKRENPRKNPGGTRRAPGSRAQHRLFRETSGSLSLLRPPGTLKAAKLHLRDSVLIAAVGVRLALTSADALARCPRCTPALPDARVRDTHGTPAARLEECDDPLSGFGSDPSRPGRDWKGTWIPRRVPHLAIPSLYVQRESRKQGASRKHRAPQNASAAARHR
mmetsp:Transcript_7407/g.19148  ORF Transcript_7407/g.19148 Transcript_7407/m.19148 type:complete len:225 (-) Transcript_7407:52-726(-)